MKNPGLPIKRSAREISLAGGSDPDRRRKIPDGRSHDTSVSAITVPGNAATFLNVDIVDLCLAQPIGQPVVIASQLLIFPRSAD